MKTFQTVVCGIMIVLFVVAGLVQLNDPDPFLWITIYLAAAIMTGTFMTKRIRATVPALCAVAALCGAAYLSTKVLGTQPLFDSEEGREMMGLGLIGAWFVIVAIWARGSQRPKIDDLM